MGHRGIGWWLAFVLCACNGDEDTDTKDTDTDADADTDTDSDTDTDTDADTDQGPDNDGDGFGAEVDCDDADDTVYPGAPDLCGDEKVTDCDRSSDDGLVTLDGTQGFDDLQSALSAAGEGSELLLCTGTYEGQFEASVPVKLVAYTDATSTVLSGNDAGTALSVPGGTEIVGLTVQHGRTGQRGGGIKMTTTGTLLVQDSVITTNRAAQGGGLFIAPDSQATLVNTLVTNNGADMDGGGAYVSDGATLDLTEGSSVTANFAQYGAGGVELVNATLLGGEVSDNTLFSYGSASYYSTYFSYYGPFGGAGIGAIGTCRVEGTEIYGNIAPTASGVSATASDLTLVDVSVHDNSTAVYDGIGGGVLLFVGSVQMEGTTEVYANSAPLGAGLLAIGGTMSGGVVRDNQGDMFGAGVLLYNGTAENMLISGNIAGEAGGGGYVVGFGTFRDVTMTGNFAPSGGGIGTTGYFSGYAQEYVVVEGGSISGNDALNGGGIYSFLPTEVLGTEIVDNTASMGAGVYVTQDRVRLTDVSVLRNVADTSGGGVWVDPGTQLAATNVDFGVDADDNLPSDVHAGEIYTDYGAGTTLTCDDGSCVLDTGR
jgi:hypothetical protein